MARLLEYDFNDEYKGLTMLVSNSQLGRVRVRKTWLTLRRVIAVAELIGLPRAAATLQRNSGSQSHSGHEQCGAYCDDAPSEQREKAQVWESICAIDRVMSMMWSLPIATSDFPLPMRPIIDNQGQVVMQAFLHRLANIASKVLDLDGVYIQDKPVSDLLSMVMSMDEELQAVANTPAKEWWMEAPSILSPAALFQYWHSYLIIRTHLRLALAYDHDQRFLYNFMSCLGACQVQCKRYIAMRPLLPKGFFAHSIVDLQALSAIVFLLLAANKSAAGPSAVASWHLMDAQQSRSLVDEAVQTMEQASARTGSQSALHGVEAIKGLRSLLEQPTSVEPQQVSLLLPLIGRIHVSRKRVGSNQGRYPEQSPSNLVREPLSEYPVDTTGSNYLSHEWLNTLSYSMDVPEDFAFLSDPSFSTEQLLSWSG